MWVCFFLFEADAQAEKIDPDIRATVRLTNGDWKPFLSQNLSEYGFGSAVVSAAFDTGHFDGR